MKDMDQKRWVAFWAARNGPRPYRIWYRDYVPLRPLPKVLAEWPCDIGVSTHDLSWPLDKATGRLDHYDLVYLMARFQWKNYTKEHYRMLVRRVLEQEVDFV